MEIVQSKFEIGDWGGPGGFTAEEQRHRGKEMDRVGLCDLCASVVEFLPADK